MPETASLVDRPCLTRQQIVSRLTGREQTLARGPTVRMWITGASLYREFRGQRSFFENKSCRRKRYGSSCFPRAAKPIAKCGVRVAPS